MERPTARRGPQSVERLAEARIEAAMAAGEFDNLPGRGAPLRLEDDSLIDPAWRLAFRVLKGAGLAPAWIEIRRELDQEIELARAGLAAVAVGDPGRRQAERRFTDIALELNHRIAQLNLLVPGPRWAKPSIDIAVEISRLGVQAPVESVLDHQARQVTPDKSSNAAGEPAALRRPARLIDSLAEDPPA